MPRGKIIEVRPSSMASGGDAIAREDSGRVVFIPGALPGELVAVEIVESRRDFARARIVDVLEASPHRVSPPCRHVARGCGGCGWQHIEADQQRRLKREIVLDSLRRLGRITGHDLAPTVELPADGYRTTVRLTVSGDRTGFRRAGSNDLVDVDSCLVAHPLITDLMSRGRFMGAHEVVLRCGARTGERLASPSPTDAAIEVPPDVRRDHIHELAAGRRWRISSASFFQSRSDGADALAEVVGEAADAHGEAGTALDLYGGVGLFAGVLADRGWRITLVEGSATSIADARVNLRDDECQIVAGDVTSWEPVAVDLVVADPSRAGLGKAGVDVIVATGARRVVLVSCDPASFGRDAGLLTRSGYTLSSTTPVDMFPQTSHIEVVGVFDRE